MAIFRYNETPGNYYVYLIEGHGDDANDGLTPETAVATLDRLVTILDTYAGVSRRHAVIKKKRIYNEGITVTRDASKPITFEFVGGCEVDGGSGVVPRFMIFGDKVIGGDFIDFGTYITTGSSTSSYFVFFEKSSFKNFTYGIAHRIISTNIYTFKATESFFVNCIMNTGGGSWERRAGFENCVIVNSKQDVSAITPSYYARNSIFSNCENDTINLLYSQIDYCCIHGKIGTKTQADIIAMGQNLNGISANPQFTDPTNGQYTVNSSSPCLYRGEGGKHIGIGEGFFLNANMMWFFQAAISNFQLTLGRLGFVDPFDNAYLRTNPIDVGAIITLERAELKAILPVVAGDFTSGPVVNTAYYPAYSNTTTYHFGAGITESAVKYRCKLNDTLNQAPATQTAYWERLTWWGVSHAANKIVEYNGKWYKAKQVTSTTWVAGEWQEVVMAHEWNIRVKVGRTYDEAEAAHFAIIPLNDTPYLDAAGLGNSDDNYNKLTALPMVFRFIIIELHAKSLI